MTTHVSNPLEVLAETVKENKQLRQHIAERLKTLGEQMKLLREQKDAAETENRRLRSKVQQDAAEIARLNKENTAFLRNQTALEAAIQMACNEVSETNSFIANATRMAVPSLAPVERPLAEALSPPKAVEQRKAGDLPSLQLIRKQVPNSVHVPPASAEAPRQSMPPLPFAEGVIQSRREPEEVPTAAAIADQFDEIENMLASSLSIDALNDAANGSGEAHIAA
jgi:hypothetical protein